MSGPSLPPDVLREIFSLLQASHHNNITTRLPQHVTVSHVNRAWRAVGLDSPMLWADIHVSEFSTKNALREFVARARECELDVNIVQNPSNNSRANSRRVRGSPNFRNALTFLTSHISRWRRLHINCGAGNLLVDIMPSIVRLHFTRLQCFELINNSPGPISHFGPFNFDARFLKTLRLHRATIHVSDRTHFSGLKTLEFSQTSCYMIDQAGIDNLSDAENVAHEPTMMELRQLEIVATIPVFPVHPSFQPSSLVYLKFGGFSGASAASIPSLVHLFDSISSPNLKDLELDSIRSFAWTAFVLSLQFSVIPKYPGLKSLTLRSLELSELDEDFMLAFPAITHLKLVSVDPEPLLQLFKNYPLTWPALTPWNISTSLGLLATSIARSN